MRRAKLEGRHIGRKPLVLDRNVILQDRQRGQSLSQLAKGPLVSRATIHRVLRDAQTTLEGSALTENTVEILLWMLMATAFGFMVGWTCGEQVCRRRQAEERVEELTARLNLARSASPMGRQLKELRGVLNDAHKHIVAVSKALQKPAR